MSKYVTSYQWGDRNQFIGPYQLEDHKNGGLNIPKNTTLIEPPEAIEGKEAIWENEIWVLKDVPKPLEAPKLLDPEIVPVPEYIPAGTPI